ncbi:Hsp20/alpha crystallin family protein [Brachybacterium huguangmaarense]|uniref:Hsp20/alpha crystallin family protein n=1 Tax=Brachybacterium huguangmaarense TaxID=1652028 RepID=A0ABY6G3K6_9MICO|nr:Hsp20/alpha crystallin family protein [Brachybacterium huguangmaarense]UYG17544.1 Hsp20/alpha crystallin family protein [Brachybacterium huguangmaarense]
MDRALNPFHDAERFLGGIARMPASLAMPMDLSRDGDTFVAEIDLPGVDPTTIDVDVEDRTLTVRAERTPSSRDEGRTWLTRERPSGTFARQLTLGTRVALDRIQADYDDGVLRLTIPMAEEAKPRKIAVAHSSTPTTIQADGSDTAGGASETA